MVHKANAAQQRGEVARLAAQFQHLGVQARDEAWGGKILQRRDLVEDFPEGAFQPDAGALATRPETARFALSAGRVLPGKIMHMFVLLPDLHAARPRTPLPDVQAGHVAPAVVRPR